MSGSQDNLFGVTVPERCPDEVRSELVTVPEGETRYTFLLDDATVELLAAGICPEHFAQQCYMALEWKREQYRVDARHKAGLFS